MAKNHKKLILGIYDVAALLPWWLGLLLALTAYLGLHYFTEQPLPTFDGQDPAMITPRILMSVLHAGANILQYLLPLVIICGAITSFFAQYKRKRLFDFVKARAIQINDLSWLEFEHLIGEVFRRQGYTVTERGGAGGDGGVDLELRRHSEKTLVQCKHWKYGKVGVAIIRELLGSMTAENATQGMVVASDGFTHEALNFALKHRIQLIGGDDLELLINQEAKQVPLTTREVDSLSSPCCPKCGSVMKLRVARRGAHTGHQFWGCARFPSCRGVL